MFTYAQAEKLLAELHAADGGVRTRAFRGRLKHLQRLGIPLGRPSGRGNKTPYSMNQVYQLAFCLECAQFGFDPTWTVKQVKKHWPSIHKIFVAAERHPGEVIFLWIRPEMMTGAWVEDFAGERQAGHMIFTAVLKGDLPEKLALVDGNFRRACLLNLTAAVRYIATFDKTTGEGA
jgi:hypothetical protein